MPTARPPGATIAAIAATSSPVPQPTSRTSCPGASRIWSKLQLLPSASKPCRRDMSRNRMKSSAAPLASTSANSRPMRTSAAGSSVSGFSFMDFSDETIQRVCSKRRPHCRSERGGGDDVRGRSPSGYTRGRLLRGAEEGFPVEYERVPRDLAVAHHEIVGAERRLAGRGEQPVQDQHSVGILEHGSLLPTWLNAHRER